MTHAYDLIVSHTSSDSTTFHNKLMTFFEQCSKEGLIEGWDIEPNEDLTQYVRQEYGEE